MKIMFKLCDIIDTFGQMFEEWMQIKFGTNEKWSDQLL